VVLCTTISAPKIERLLEIGAGKGIIDDEQHLMAMRNLSYCLDIHQPVKAAVSLVLECG
jgi:hypothetical protein